MPDKWTIMFLGINHHLSFTCRTAAIIIKIEDEQRNRRKWSPLTSLSLIGGCVWFPFHSDCPFFRADRLRLARCSPFPLAVCRVIGEKTSCQFSHVVFLSGLDRVSTPLPHRGSIDRARRASSSSISYNRFFFAAKISDHRRSVPSAAIVWGYSIRTLQLV